ncbi:transcription/translation regulatory transformer protein RfaH [Pseudidiomarina tainanensis]|uniref:Transcription/translation regulatory transformer protein RfaH n=1 Tax=Pseudidiomarina tainanensis TaxID=502365 RepID=A0ACD2HI53_9GAMM|nr:transcription/translation regulatory transformer protein RfaH [Pseudidiomarina tainanensis]RZQ56281.1 transcription/translation regulatory transformer protein RfaH [Pseudidiomarina tainanensis]
MPWLVVRTKPRQELRALQNLENQNIQVFLPMLTSSKVRRGKRVDIDEPMFPGYLFIQLTDTLENLHKVKHTFGVLSILRFGQKLAEVNDELIVELQKLNEQHSVRLKSAPEPGDKVTINDGPFKGFLAKVIKLDGASRCIVLLDWLNQQVSASVDYSQIEKNQG